MKIRTKITLFSLILSLVPLSILGIIAYQNGESALKKNLGETFQLVAQQAIDKVDRNLYEVYRNVNTWSELSIMEELITGDVDGKISLFLIGLHQEYGYFSSLNAMNRQGLVVASSHPEFIGRDVSGDGFFQRAIQGRIKIEDLFFDEVSGEWVISFSFPVRAKFQNDEVIGVLSARWNAKELASLTQVVPDKINDEVHARIFLIQDDGLVISGPPAESHHLFRDNWIRDNSNLGLQIRQQRDGYLVEIDEGDQEALIGYAFSKGYRDFPGMGWRALVIKDAKAAFASVTQLKMALLSVEGIVIFFVFALSLIVTRSLTRPILQISNVAGRVALGDFSVKMDYESKDEIGSLTTTFNQMIDDLKNQRAQLVDKHYVDSIIANIINSLIVIDPEGIIRRVNPSTLSLLGYSEDELIGQAVEKIFGEELPSTGASLAALMRKGFFKNIETTYRSKDGRSIPVWFSGSFIHDSQNSLEGIVCVAQDITEQKKNVERFNYLANHDPLTNLPNRVLFNDRLGQAITRSIRRQRHAAVLVLDLDRFKNINDTLGHAAGDLLLQTVSERLTGCIRDSDTVARFGGDEFAFILDDVARPEDVGKIAKKILDTFAEPMTLMGHELFITTSIGISLFPADGRNPEALLKNADTAMYRAKEQGRNNSQHFSADMDVRALEYLTLETNLRHALDRNELILHFQPMVECLTGRIIGTEALVRWIHPDLGMIPPLRFIPIAEETGLIEPIGNWVLKTACKQNKAWQALGLPPIRVAVNLSARQFQNKRFSSFVNRTLLETELDPAYLELELTESIIMKDAETTIETLREFNGLGIDISIDDFGTGYSSLNYLKRFPVKTLKIDKSFVHDITSDPDDAAITKTVIAMGHSLNLKIVAEGVETREQLEFLRAMQCDTIQGYYFSKPLPAEALTLLLKTTQVLPLQRQEKI